MADFLDKLAKDALETVKSGYYHVRLKSASFARKSLKSKIIDCRNAPIIAEIKPSSPSLGILRRMTSLEELATAIQRGGAIGVSVLTEPKHFGGSLEALLKVKSLVDIPVLMKDIVVDPVQIEAAARLGADAVLLILSVFSRGYATKPLEDMLRFAHYHELEVLLETHSSEEFSQALRTGADLIGINNRDLGTLRVDLNTTVKVLSELKSCDRVVVSESGIQKPEDVRLLHNCGAKAFLVGSAIMLSEDVESKVRELVTAI